jgi:hypothetical protein
MLHNGWAISDGLNMSEFRRSWVDACCSDTVYSSIAWHDITFIHTSYQIPFFYLSCFIFFKTSTTSRYQQRVLATASLDFIQLGDSTRLPFTWTYLTQTWLFHANMLLSRELIHVTWTCEFYANFTFSRELYTCGLLWANWRCLCDAILTSWKKALSPLRREACQATT